MSYTIPSAGRAMMAGGTSPDRGGRVWKPPKRQSLSGGEITPQTIARNMMSGEAFSPYRSMMAESQAASEAQKRANIANLINTKGLGKQGFGTQLARESEAGLMKSRYLNNLNTAIAEQGMKERGADLGLGIQAQVERERAARASESLARESMESSKALAEEKLRLAIDEMTSSSKSRDREFDIMEQELALREKLGLGQLGLGESELALRERLGMGELDLQKLLGEGQLGLGESELALREKLGMGELDLQKLLGEGQLGLGESELALREKLGMGELDLQKILGEGGLDLAGRELDLRELLGIGELGIGNRELDLMQQYQNNQNILANKTLDLETEVQRRKLDLAFEDLSVQDKHLMHQINLGTEQLTTQDKQFMAQLGVTEQGQNWAAEYQKMLLDIEKDKINLMETDPSRLIQMGRALKAGQGSVSSGTTTDYERLLRSLDLVS